MMSVMTNDELAAAWAAALTSGDLGRLDALVSPATRVWHNYDDTWQSWSEANAGAPAEVSFSEVTAEATPGGFVVRAAVEVGGRRLSVTQVHTVEDGRVATVEEYVQPAGAGR